MKPFLFLVLPCILVACAMPVVPVTRTPTESAFERTKLFAITAEAETQTSGYPANDATVTAIIARKYILGTAMAKTMTAMPTETPTPPVPPNTPPCRPEDLKAQPYGSMGATGSVYMSGGIVNIGASACYLQASPVFNLIDDSGKFLDIAYDTSNERSGSLLLSPGQSVGFNFNWGNWCGEEVVGGVLIRLTLPAHSGSIDIPPGGLNSPIYTGGHCDDPSQKSFVYVISGFEVGTNQP
jgi:hypothetical protein